MAQQFRTIYSSEDGTIAAVRYDDSDMSADGIQLSVPQDALRMLICNFNYTYGPYKKVDVSTTANPGDDIFVHFVNFFHIVPSTGIHGAVEWMIQEINSFGFIRQ